MIQSTVVAQSNWVFTGFIFITFKTQPWSTRRLCETEEAWSDFLFLQAEMFYFFLHFSKRCMSVSVSPSCGTATFLPVSVAKFSQSTRPVVYRQIFPCMIFLSCIIGQQSNAQLLKLYSHLHLPTYSTACNVNANAFSTLHIGCKWHSTYS